MNPNPVRVTLLHPSSLTHHSNPSEAEPPSPATDLPRLANARASSAYDDRMTHLRTHSCLLHYPAVYIPTRHHICYSDPLRVNRLCLCPCHASFMLRGFACLLARSWNSCALHKRERGEGERGVTCCKTSWAMASLLQLPHIFDLQHLINTLLASRLRVFVLSFFLSCFLMRPLSLPARAVPMQHCVMRGVVGSNGEGQVLRKRVVGCEGSAGHVLFAGRVCSGCQTRALRAVCRAFDSSSFLEIAVWMCKMPAIMRKQTVGRESC